MYVFNQEGRLQRLRTQEAFREDAWAQTSSGIILPLSQPEEKPEEEVEVQWQQSASGIFLPGATPQKKVAKPTCISLFTGAGGFDLGFHRAGWRIVAASDYDTSCAWTYCYNMGARPIQMHFITKEDRERFVNQVVKHSQRKPQRGELWSPVELDEQDRAYFHRHEQYPGPAEIEDATPHYFLGDVRKLTGQMILEAVGMQVGEPGCIIGGPPCQGFSRAGRRDVMDPRNSLIFEFARLILEVRPKTMVMENVPDIVNMITPEGVPVVDAFCKILAEGSYAGYKALKRALEMNAKAWGVLQGQGAGRSNKRQDEASLEEDEDDKAHVAQMSLF